MNLDSLEDELTSVTDSDFDVLKSARLLSLQAFGQQWLPSEIDFSVDRASSKSLISEKANTALQRDIAALLLGEYTGLDFLGALQLGCPTEDDLIFLSTQVGDEARHTIVLQRIWSEVFCEPEPLRKVLADTWAPLSVAQKQSIQFESDLISAVICDPTDYSSWLKAVTIFHLFTEGVLGIAAQTSLIVRLRKIGLLPGMHDALSGIIADEVRHVSYGIWAIRRGIKDGYYNDIYLAFEKAVTLKITCVLRQFSGAELYEQLARLRRAVIQRAKQAGMLSESQERLHCLFGVTERNGLATV